MTVWKVSSEPDVLSEIPPKSERKVRSVLCKAKSVLRILGTPYILDVARLPTKHLRGTTAYDDLFGTSSTGISVRTQRSGSLACPSRLTALYHDQKPSRAQHPCAIYLNLPI